MESQSQTQLSDFTFTFMHWTRTWKPTPVFLSKESKGQGTLRGEGSCGGGRAPRDSAGSGETEEGLTSRGGRNLRLPLRSIFQTAWGRLKGLSLVWSNIDPVHSLAGVQTKGPAALWSQCLQSNCCIPASCNQIVKQPSMEPEPQRAFRSFLNGARPWRRHLTVKELCEEIYRGWKYGPAPKIRQLKSICRPSPSSFSP